MSCRFISLWLLTSLLVFASCWFQFADAGTSGVTANIEILQTQLDTLKRRVTEAQDDKQLARLSDESQEIITTAEEVQPQIADALDAVTTQLNVLGPEPKDDIASESSEVRGQRKGLERQRELLEKYLNQVQSIEKNSRVLLVQIASLRRDILRAHLTLNNGSVFSYAFWQPAIQLSPSDHELISQFWLKVSAAIDKAFRGPWLPGTLVYFTLLCMLPFTYQWLVRGITWGTPKIIRGGRLVRSFYSIMVVLLTMVLTGFMAWILYHTLTRIPGINEQLGSFFKGWLGMCLFTAQLLGVINALLSLVKPSWRLIDLSDSVARILRPFLIGIVGISFLSGTLELINDSAGVSASVSVVSSAVTILLLVICIGAMAWRVNYTYSHESSHENDEEPKYPPQAVLFHVVIVLFCVVVLVAMGLGYISFARYLVYKFMWGGMVVCSAFLLARLWEDMCNTFSTPRHQVGKTLQALLKLQNQHLSMMAVVLSGIGRVLVALIALIFILNGTFDNTALINLVKKVGELWGGAGFGHLNIIPSSIINAIMVLVLGCFLIQRGRRWLTEKFFPSTLVDKGMQASLIMLFTNLGYAVTVVFAFSSLGVKWNSLAWIVSALSVGIGFGLQEIVKNFISGLILLTERPVRVGDLVSISGIEGDIKRINVRATEIQLGDRSTVIVPNSQFISQNVRNATMGNAQGVVTITLTYPLESDPNQVREILLQVFEQHESILDNPAPSVRLTELNANGITISVTGRVSSPRVISLTKSELLFNILSQLRQKHIDISVPQSIVLRKDIDVDD